MKVGSRHELLWALILRWYATECEIAGDPLTFPPPRAAPLALIIAVAKQRVIDVLCGEIRWSECTPGDRAIWMMRSRMQHDVVPEPSAHTIAQAAWNAAIVAYEGGLGMAPNSIPSNTAFQRWFASVADDIKPRDVRNDLEITMKEIQEMPETEQADLHRHQAGWKPHLHA